MPNNGVQDEGFSYLCLQFAETSGSLERVLSKARQCLVGSDLKAMLTMALLLGSSGT